MSNRNDDMIHTGSAERGENQNSISGSNKKTIATEIIPTVSPTTNNNNRETGGAGGRRPGNNNRNTPGGIGNQSSNNNNNGSAWKKTGRVRGADGLGNDGNNNYKRNNSRKHPGGPSPLHSQNNNNNHSRTAPAIPARGASRNHHSPYKSNDVVLSIGSPLVRVMTENDDPCKILWKAIHLDTDAADKADLKPSDVLDHPRLHGTLLAMADGRTRVDAIQAAAAMGINLAEVKDEGSNWNLLHAAVSSGSEPVLNCLLKECATNQIDKMINEYSALLGTTKWTPLLLAVKNGFEPAVDLLLAKKADPYLCVHLLTPDLTDRKTGAVINRKEGRVYPLFFAVKNCSQGIVQSIYEAMQVKRPCRLSEILDSKQRTVIHYLSERATGLSAGSSEVFEYLLSIDPAIHNMTDMHGNTPLHEACRRGCDDLAVSFISLLSCVGMDLEKECLAQNKDDISPFLIAVATGLTESVRALLNYSSELLRDKGVGESIVKSLEKGEIMHAINLTTINLTKLDEFEKGALNAFIGLTNEPDQAQLVRVVKRLGPYYCMSFIAEFTVSDISGANPAMFRKDHKARTKGGHFLTLLKAKLLDEGRHEDWSYIRMVTDLTHRKMRGRQKKPVNKKEYINALRMVSGGL